MKLNNNQIYQYTQSLTIFNNCNIKLPVRINFLLQKNIQKIMQLGQEIEVARMNIAHEFGIANEDGTSYEIPSENIQAAQQELNDLFNIEQDIDLHIFKLEEFDGIELSYQELSAIMFMIEE